MQILVSVTNAHEAELAISAGIRLIDLKDTSQGALASLNLEESQRIMQVIQSQQLPNMMVSATVGDGFQDLQTFKAQCEEKKRLGVDVIKIPACVLEHAQVLSWLAEFNQHQKMVVVFSAEQLQANDYELLNVMALCKRLLIYGVMIDTQTKSKTLWQLCELRLIKQFFTEVKKMHFFTGIAGGLLPQDLILIRELSPNFAGFRSGVCEDGQRASQLSLLRLKGLSEVLIA